MCNIAVIKSNNQKINGKNVISRTHTYRKNINVSERFLHVGHAYSFLYSFPPSSLLSFSPFFPSFFISFPSSNRFRDFLMIALVSSFCSSIFFSYIYQWFHLPSFLLFFTFFPIFSMMASLTTSFLPSIFSFLLSPLSIISSFFSFPFLFFSFLPSCSSNFSLFPSFFCFGDFLPPLFSLSFSFFHYSFFHFTAISSWSPSSIKSSQKSTNNEEMTTIYRQLLPLSFSFSLANRIFFLLYLDIKSFSSIQYFLKEEND